MATTWTNTTDNSSTWTGVEVGIDYVITSDGDTVITSDNEIVVVNHNDDFSSWTNENAISTTWTNEPNP